MEDYTRRSGYLVKDYTRRSGYLVEDYTRRSGYLVEDYRKEWESGEVLPPDIELSVAPSCHSPKVNPA